jgi:hypothetical protein
MVGAQGFFGHGPVAVGRITPEEFIDKVRTARREMIDAPRFDVAFQERVLQDPTMARAFGAYLELVRAGTAPASDEKKADAEVVFNRVQVVAFLEQMEDKLATLIAQRADAPVDLVRLGLKIIQRNGDVQETVTTPLLCASTAREMAEMSGLSPAQRVPFLERIAKAALQELSLPGRCNDDKRRAILQWLNYALGVLAEMDLGQSVVASYAPEAERIAKELDGRALGATVLHTIATYLKAAQPSVRARAAARLLEAGASMESSARTRTPPRANTAAENDAWTAIVTIAARSKALLAEAPGWIEAITVCGQASDAGLVGTPQVKDGETRAACLASFIAALGKALPSLQEDDDLELHKVLCEKGLDLVLQSIATDQSRNLAILAGEMTRNRALVGRAVDELLSPEFIRDAPSRADAAAAVLKGLLDNGQIDRAWDLFNSETLSRATDKLVRPRHAAIFVHATRVAITSGMQVSGSDPAREWLATAYLRAIDVALTPEPPDFATVSTVVGLLSQPGFSLDPQSTIDLVGKVQAAVAACPSTVREEQPSGRFEGATPMRVSLVAPPLVALLGKHADDEGCMQKAAALLSQVVRENEEHYDGYLLPGGGTALQHCHMLDLMDTCSRIDRLSGHVAQLAKSYMERSVDKRLADGRDSKLVSFAQRVSGFGMYADKEQLARLRPPRDDHECVRLALAFAGDVELTGYARELVADFAQRNLGREVSELGEADRASFLYAEAALRRAVPNLMSEQAAVGLIKAFQQSRAPKEALVLVRTYMPQEIIRSVLDQVGDTEIRDFLAGRTRQAKVDGHEPVAGEAIPVAVVAAGTRVPTEKV